MHTLIEKTNFVVDIQENVITFVRRWMTCNKVGILLKLKLKDAELEKKT